MIEPIIAQKNKLANLKLPHKLLYQFLSISKNSYQKVVVFIKAKPLTNFFLVLLILISLIITGNILTTKTIAPQKVDIVKAVQIYQISESPKVTLQAKIEKTGVIKVSALTPGIIQKINFNEGDQVKKGAILVNLSSTYLGGNAAVIQRQLAQQQYQNIQDTIDPQKEIIKTQKEIAEKSESNASELRNIANQSIQETKDSINLNQSILDTLNQNQTNLEKNNTGGINDAAILQIKSSKSQVQAALNQLRSGLRQTELQAASDKPPAQLATLQKDITLKQLDLQQKALDLGLEASRLQLALAQINEALYFPASPFNATVQKVNVKVGQPVNPGTPIMTLGSNENQTTAVVNIPQNLVNTVSSKDPSTLYIGDQTVDINPNFVSTEATDGMLYSIFYTIPEKFSKNLAEGESIKIDIPAMISQGKENLPFIPLDSVYQSTNTTSVFVTEGDKAVSKNIVLGNLFGNFVEVKSGLTINDQVILNRNILAGDKISIQQ